MTLNEPVFLECARALARKALDAGGGSDAERLAYAFRRSLARKPNAAESSEILALLGKERDRFAADGQAARELLAAEPPGKAAAPGGDAGSGGPAPTDLAAWTVVARVILNLDETVTKE